MNARSDGLPKFDPRRARPYGVTYRKRTIYIGSFITLEQAALRADEYLRNESNG